MSNAPVVVAMSGGVDSSVAALLLKEAGYDAVGISMQVWDYRNHGGCSTRATCCAPDDFTDARKVAATLDIPYYVFDFENEFREEVINPFIKSYQNGMTPNPCIECNSKVKFASLRTRAESFGCSAVATGHYARIAKDDSGYHLLRGTDQAKDQSYFLYRMNQQELARTLFPVGHMTKSEVRALAREAGLVTAEKAESQDICFVSGEVGAFVERIGGKSRKGSIVSIGGQKLGEHDGVHQFTVGQRRGLRVGGSEERMYVVDIDSSKAEVTVGVRKDLERESFVVQQLSWVSPFASNPSKASYPYTLQGRVQVRHRHEGCPVNVEVIDPSTAIFRFTETGTSVAPGQAAVLYDSANTELLGGGTIVRASVEELSVVREREEIRHVG